MENFINQNDRELQCVPGYIYLEFTPEFTEIEPLYPSERIHAGGSRQTGKDHIDAVARPGERGMEQETEDESDAEVSEVRAAGRSRIRESLSRGFPVPCATAPVMGVSWDIMPRFMITIAAEKQRPWCV